LRARCSLADSIDADYVRALRQFYPDLPLVAYVNTPAAVKAEADVCCTSANAAPEGSDASCTQLAQGGSAAPRF
jgi:quinolinate synthase